MAERTARSIARSRDGARRRTPGAGVRAFGASMVCFAVGVKRALRAGKSATWGPILLGAFGRCVIGAGSFVTDSPALLQRISIFIGWVWVALFAIQTLRKGSPVSR